MTPAAPAVLVVADAAPGPAAAGLQSWLGPERALRLETILLRRAVDWALRVAPRTTFALLDAQEGGDLPSGVRRIEARPGAAGIRAAAQEAFDSTGGPLLAVGTRLPALGDYHARAAATDLATGCRAVLGVAIGGGLYLVGLDAPRAELLALLGTDLDGETTRRRAREVTGALGLEVGMLHYERALVTPRDAEAMLADPLLPEEIASVLRG